MLTVDMYLCRPDATIDDVSAVSQNPYRYFIHLDDKRVHFMMDSLAVTDLKGAIVLRYGDEVLIGFEQCDQLEQLWSFLLNALEILDEKKIVEGFVPDQSSMTIQQLSSQQIEFCLNQRKWTFSKKEFFSVLLQHAEHFFIRMEEMLSSKTYLRQLNQIKRMQRFAH
ncbi:hypothetical protein [Priestia koreensis]|uniref:hypothetical protein n=1 Tax=Priestia koreensis TaxID=284581 RepID=UPI001F5A9582|nr:hypothetical protein [Priestia koreensis]UNL86262.1 hypothetical protein IE339_07125 [Priestia koreensis]